MNGVASTGQQSRGRRQGAGAQALAGRQPRRPRPRPRPGLVYPHAEPGHHARQQYLPTALLGTYFYAPSHEGYEAQVKDRLARWREAQEKALGLAQTETLPELSEASMKDIKHRLGRRAESE
jgi:hypothetical protein